MRSLLSNKAFLILTLIPALVAGLSFNAALLEAQLQLSGFRGTVTDPSGAAIVNAEVTATNEASGISRTTVTTEVGDYELRGLDNGTYTIAVTLPGFKRYVNTGVVVYAGDVRRVDVELEIGEQATEITVSEEGSTIDTDVSVIKHRLGNQEVYGANIGAALIYNIYQNPGTEARAQVHGGFANNLSEEQDGIPTNAYGSFRATQETLQEVHQVDFNAAAEYRVPTNVFGIGKQGTNQFHGEIFGEFSNAALNALPSGNSGPRPPSKTNKRWSYEASGPVWVPRVYDGRNKTFFHFLYQPASRENPVFHQGRVVPTAAMRAGDLNEFIAYSGCAFPSAANPNPNVPCPTNPFDVVNGIQQPFPGNIVPANMISPIARNVLNNTGILPLPNHGEPGQLFDNFRYVSFNAADNDWQKYTFDHAITDTNTLTIAHYRYNNVSPEGRGDPFPNAGFVERGNTRALSISNSHTFGANVVNEFQYAWNRQQSVWAVGDVQGRDYLTQILGVTELGGRVLREGVGTPHIKVRTLGRQLSSHLGSFNPLPSTLIGSLFSGETDYEDGEVQQWRNNISINRGTHLFKTGIEYRHQSPHMFSTISIPAPFGIFDFNGKFTGYDFGDLLLGLPFTTQIDGVRPRAEARHNEFGFYFQDDWKVTPRVTITPGIRFQHYGVPSEVLSDTIYNFDQATQRVVVPSDRALQHIAPGFPVEVVTAREANYPSGLRNFKSVLVDPRLGLAFRVTDSFVIRGGYGIFHVPFVKSTAWAIANVFGEFDRAGILAGHVWGPYQFSELFQDNEIVNGVPNFTWERPFPAGTVGPTSLTSADVDLRKNNWPYDQQWNITLEKEFGLGWSGRASWVGSKGVSWPYIEDLQAIRPGSSYQPFDTSKFANVHALQLGGNSKYNALQLELTRQFSTGIYFRGWFNWSKSLNDVQGGLFGSSSGFFQSSAGQRHNDYGWQAGVPDLTSRWLAVVPLPFGKGQQFASGASTWLHHLIGDWTIVPRFTTSGRGRFIPVFSGGNHPALRLRGDGARPDLVGGCNPNDTGFEGRGQLWNRGCFALPPESRYGTAPRGALRHPNRWGFDFNIFKEWKLIPALEQSPYFKLEAYIGNLLNHANSSGASTNVADANFGMVFRGSGSRRISLRARIGF